MKQRIRVLIVDDSAMIRSILSDGLAKDQNIEVVGTAADPYIARDKIVELKPDVLTLDVEMPRMDGLEFLRKLMVQHPIPVVMVSALTERGKRVTIEALEAGAIDFVAKPRADVARGLNEMMIELRTKVKLAASANVSHYKSQRHGPVSIVTTSCALAETTDKIIVIGASAGGTEAIKEILSRMPSTSPGIVLVQHMPEGFTRMFAERLNTLSPLYVKEAADGDRVMPGVALVAPGSFQMKVIRSGGIYRVKCEKGDKVSGHCPSVDVLMHSAASSAGANAVGVILTGMGADGASGLKAMHDAGARTIAQNQESCVVFGMPRAAINNGAVDLVLSLEEIPERVFGLFI